eukprot:CAMPEP_0202894980 /NCGR_PEP_ID=MMETSP1392-20130828/4258_1 /ASSEMBLY_ACC=CAM_ASM_000868 /TAXON_ID=225041 /ORGANISM="Chlamydomonas chlamydogama, Strain SAG 11-48b" /LENGTH=659 /DNA_ID=CAMNT_0049579841 /DNA_START=154 /DNA_END=2133 /DNA_ORIENTATION=-
MAMRMQHKAIVAAGLSDAPRVPVVSVSLNSSSSRCTRLVCRAKYGYEEETRRPSRGGRGARDYDDDDFSSKRRGGKGKSQRSMDDEGSYVEEYEEQIFINGQPASTETSAAAAVVDDDRPRFTQVDIPEDDEEMQEEAGGRPERGSRYGSREGYGNRQGQGQGNGRRPQRSFNGPRGEGGQNRGYQQRGEGGGYQQRGEGGGYQQRGEGGSGEERGEGGRRYGGQRGPRGEGRQGGAEGEGGRRWIGLTPEQLAARETVNKAIAGAEGWRALSHVVTTQGSNLDAEHVSQILFRLARGNRPADPNDRPDYDSLLSSLLGWVLALLPTYRPRQVSQTLYSLARLELWNSEVMTGLVESSTRQMGNFNSQGYSNMIWALARLNYNPGQQWLNSFMYGATKYMREFSAMDLANMASGMSKLGAVPTPEWAAAFWGVSANQAGRFSGLEFINLVMAVGTLAKDAGCQPPQEWVDAMFSANVARVRESTKIPDLTRTLWALSNLSAKPSKEWMDSAWRAYAQQAMYASPSDLGNICLYMGRYLAHPAPADVADRVARNTVKIYNRVSGDELASIAYLLAVSGYKANDRWTDDLVIAAKKLLPTCSLMGLEMLYNALPQLGSGYRLNETVAEAATRYNDLLAQQQQAVDAAQQQQQQPEEVVAAA